MILSDLIDRMVAAGMSAGEAGDIAAQIYAAGVAAASVRSRGAERTRRWRESVTKRHEPSQSDTLPEASPTVTERHKASQCDVSTVSPLTIEDKNIKESKRQRSERGSRIAPDWEPCEADLDFALAEGFSHSELQREIGKFRDYWGAKPGQGGVKLDWAKTWRNWIRSGAERSGKAPKSIPGNSTSDELKIDWDKQVSQFAKGFPWSAKWYGPEPGHLGCRVPPEILEKHGYGSPGELLQFPKISASMKSI